jgi:hypothetical protein
LGALVLGAVAQAEEPAGDSPKRPFGAQQLEVLANAVQLFTKSNLCGTEGLLVLDEHAPGTPTKMPANTGNASESARWRLDDGIVVVLFEHSGGRGRQLVLWGSGQFDKFASTFMNKFSSWAWYRVGSPGKAAEDFPRQASALSPGREVKADTIRIYRKKEWEDELQSIRTVTGKVEGVYRELPEEARREISSLAWRLPEGVVVIFYKNKGTHGSYGEQLAIWGDGQLERLKNVDYNDGAWGWAWFRVGHGVHTDVLASPAPQGSSDSD